MVFLAWFLGLFQKALEYETAILPMLYFSRRTKEIMKPSKIELTDLVNKIRGLSNELTETVSRTLVLRHEARVPEKHAQELESKSQTTSGVDDPKLKNLKVEADRLRAEAANARVRYRLLYGEIFGLKEDLRTFLLHYGEDGRRISDSIENIGFSSWSRARGWPHPYGRFDEEGIPRGLATLGKILAAAIDVLFPRRHKPDPVAEKRKKAILELCAKYYGKTRNYLRAVCEGLKKRRIPMPRHWVTEWSSEHKLPLQNWDWVAALQWPKAKHRIENHISRLARITLRPSKN